MLRINLLLLLAVIVSALYLVQTQYASRRLFTELDQTITKGRQLETERERLQVEQRAQSAPGRIEHLAQQQGLQAATPAITAYVRDNRGVGEH
ncbi:cell division protein FtsL [Comamonas nitrativorans]|uniref:Cell division protein FtsL n=1 Tax=Comamonas nitrativorans TaxID=108437 RepID=A0ABV9H1I2_9BURK|nr:cell division protein FtsL [Comamonas sp.]